MTFLSRRIFMSGPWRCYLAAGDVRMIAHGGVSGAKRIVRHLWRMSIAFFIAAASFFLGQQKVMPAYMRGSKLLFVPPLLILICVDLLAVSHVVHEDVQTQRDSPPSRPLYCHNR